MQYHKGCGGVVVMFSSFTENHDIETPVCTKCGATGAPIRTEPNAAPQQEHAELEISSA